MIINPYLVQPSAPSYGTLTTAWIAATGETDLTILGALNTLETDLTTYGLTAKMKALYPMVGGTAAKHKFNFMDARDLDAAFRLTFATGWTHSSTGMTPLNTYADTFLSPLASLSLNSTHLSVYSRTSVNSGGEQNDMGAFDGSKGSLIISWTNASIRYVAIDTNGITVPALASTTGLLIENRRNSTQIQSYRNGNLVNTAAAPSVGMVNLPLYIGNRNALAGYSTKQYGFASIGDGLTDTEAANFYTAVQAYQTTLGRQV